MKLYKLPDLLRLSFLFFKMLTEFGKAGENMKIFIEWNSGYGRVS